MSEKAEVRQEILDAIHQVISHPQDVLTVRLISANPLSQEMRESLLAPVYELSIPYRVDVEVDRTLLNGYILWLNDFCIDHSLKYSLRGVSDAIHSKEELGTWDNYNRPRISEAGTVIRTADGIAIVEGLYGCVSGELIDFSQDRFGIAMNLERDHVGVMLLCDNDGIHSGSICRRTGNTVSVPVGEGMKGRVVNALGEPIDGRALEKQKLRLRPIEAPAAPIVDRAAVNQPLYTGITAIDAMIPIGRGQRELIIGDRQTGKTTIALDTIINQKGRGVSCIYVAIGQKMSTVAQTVALLENHDAMSYTTVVVASASDAPGLQYIAPYAGCAMAEELMYNGEDVLIVYDDLTRHSQAYRAISLLLRRPPGREAFPGDIFYIHSRLLERAAKLAPSLGGGSMTALPIVETQAGDISAYVPTNVISITDGQIYLETGLFFSGQRPAVNVGLSVSRVGGAAQETAMRKTAGPLRVNLAQYREKQSFAQFGSDVDEETVQQLARGRRLYELLRQAPEEARQMADSVIILYLATENAFNDIAVEDLRDFAASFLNYVNQAARPIWNKVAEGKALDEETKQALKKTLDLFRTVYRKDER